MIRKGQKARAFRLAFALENLPGPSRSRVAGKKKILCSPKKLEKRIAIPSSSSSSDLSRTSRLYYSAIPCSRPALRDAALRLVCDLRPNLAQLSQSPHFPSNPSSRTRSFPGDLRTLKL